MGPLIMGINMNQGWDFYFNPQTPKLKGWPEMIEMSQRLFGWFMIEIYRCPYIYIYCR